MAEIVQRLFDVLGHRWVRGRLRDLALGALLIIAIFNRSAFESGFEAVVKAGACTAVHRYAALLPTVTAADSALPTMSYTVTKRNGYCTIVPKASTSTTGPTGAPGNGDPRPPTRP